VSKPAKANFPLSNACKRATSSITPPRAAFTIAATGEAQDRIGEELAQQIAEILL
jgi:hypothetical protein